MFRAVVQIFKHLEDDYWSWRRAGSALVLAMLLVTGGGCWEKKSNLVSPVSPIPGGQNPPSRAIMSTPSCGSRLNWSTTFTWTPGTEVDYYTFEIHGSQDEQDPLAIYDPTQNTSLTVPISQIDERSVLWVKLTTYHLEGQESDPYWCEYWYPEDEGWILDHLEYTAEERWYHGSGGSTIIEENMNVGRSTRTFTPSPIDHVWDTGHYRVEETLTIEELPEHVPTGGQAIVRASAVANISTSGLGFSRDAVLGLSINGSSDQTGEPGAENRDVTLEVGVGPNTIGATERITFEATAGLNSINDSRLIVRVVAVYQQY